MKWLESRVFWGVLLIVAGVMFLLDNLNILPLGDLFWMSALALAGFFFISIFAQNRMNWWALIPGFAVISIAALIGLDLVFPLLGDQLGGTVVLGGISLSFAAIYLLDRRRWWAVIPFGVLATLALIAGLDNLLPNLETGGVLFIGLGLTFALVAVLPNPDGELRWAWIPAVLLMLFGVILMAAADNLLPYLWPVALILVGLALVARTLRSGKTSKEEEKHE